MTAADTTALLEKLDKPDAWDCVAPDTSRYIIHAQGDRTPEGWVSYQPLFALTPSDLASIKAALVEREWQTIDTAPKDGTTVDIWRAINEARLTGARWVEGKWLWKHYRYDEADDQITHWRPLPAPPRAALGKDAS